MNTNLIDVSILVPVYNSERTINRCLDSVLKQDSTITFEVLVGYNPSADKTLEIVNGYLIKDKRIKIINLPGYGAAMSRNELVKHANGEFVTFIDADDEYESNYLNVLYSKVKEGYDVVNCSFKTVKNGKKHINVFRRNIVLNSYEALKALLDDSYMRAFMWNKIIRKELLVKPNMPIMKDSKPLFEDLPILFYVFKNANKVVSIDTPLYLYNKDAGGITSVANKDRLLFHIKSYAMVKAMCDNDQLISIFVKNKRRAMMSFYFDALVSKKVTNKSAHKQIKEHKKDIKILFSKSKDIAASKDIISYVNESFK